MARPSCKEKAAIFNARTLSTHEIMRSRDAQCNTGNDLLESLSEIVQKYRTNVPVQASIAECNNALLKNKSWFENSAKCVGKLLGSLS